MRTGETRAVTIEMLPGNIFLVNMKPGAELGIEQAKELISVTNAMIDRSIPFRAGIYDVSLITSITREAQDYLRSGQDIVGKVVAVAILSYSSTGRMLGNLFVEMGPPRDFNVRFFDSPTQAEHWVRGELRAAMEREKTD